MTRIDKAVKDCNEAVDNVMGPYDDPHDNDPLNGPRMLTSAALIVGLVVFFIFWIWMYLR